MARKVPVPELSACAVPSVSPAVQQLGPRLPPKRSATLVQSPQSELPDLMEAFWGDSDVTVASENSGTSPARGRRSSGGSVAG
jgi:hypothetical protein